MSKPPFIKFSLLSEGFFTFSVSRVLLFTPTSAATMYSKRKAAGGVKLSTPAHTRERHQKAAAKLKLARTALVQRQNQVADLTSAYMMYAAPRHKESKFFDPWVNNGTKILICATNSTLANSAGGYVLTTAANPGAVVLNQIPQGTTQNSRLGRKARITGVYIKGHLSTAGAASTIAKASVSLVHQVPPNNAVAMPNFTDIWVAQQQNSQRNVDNNDKLKVVKSIGPHVLTGGTTTPNDTSLVDIDEYIDLSKKEIITEWTQADTTGVYGNMEKGALMMYCLSNALEATGIVAVLSARVYFEDY